MKVLMKVQLLVWLADYAIMHETNPLTSYPQSLRNCRSTLGPHMMPIM